MKDCKPLSVRFTIWSIGILWLILMMIAPATSNADDKAGEKLYSKLSQIANGKGDIQLFENLNDKSPKIDWEKARKMEFSGNLRILKLVTDKVPDKRHTVYLLRTFAGEVYILAIPDDPALLEEDADSFYAGLNQMLENKMVFNVGIVQSIIDGQTFRFAGFTAKPSPVLL